MSSSRPEQDDEPTAPATLEAFYERFGSRISQQSERLFLEEFLFPLLKEHIGAIEPQHVFIDSTGRSRRIDFAYEGSSTRIALEVNGETYHSEGIIANDVFDDNLFRQNEIVRRGYQLARYSYNQLQSPVWRPVVVASLRNLFAEHAPELLTQYELAPSDLQVEALEALEHARTVRDWAKAVVVMPTGTGKTILSAIDARRHGGRVLFLSHRLDLLTQSVEAFKAAWGSLNFGVLTGDERSNVDDCDVLFASKDTIRQAGELARYPKDWFSYIVVDEVHHGQSMSYQSIFQHFKPRFMLGMTATPDRTDRKDIFELFDYNKAYEVSLSEVIERGYLVPYTYVGLTDNVDYSRIRYQNNRYRVQDLERLLIVPERNQAILDAYLAEDLGHGDKAIAFCVSIEHAERMAGFFRTNGILADAIHSGVPDREAKLQAFRSNELQVVFTVDLFNEGIDVPNVQVLLFLRPTESKTVFLQQLGRGLRQHPGKERVRVLDFIGNYQRANLVRKLLSKGNHRTDETDANGRRVRKLVYEYSPNCEIRFDREVEEILDRQDAADLGVDRDDLRDAYFALSEQLKRKVTRQDLDEHGDFPSRLYSATWGSWVKFLRDVGEYTEASYHYPQGTHLGHVLAIIWYFGLPSREGTAFEDRFIRLRGELAPGRAGVYQRQLKYKLQAAMELGLLEDDRAMSDTDVHIPQLTPLGMELRNALEGDLSHVDLGFPTGPDGVPGTTMAHDEAFFNSLIREAVRRDESVRHLVRRILLHMPAVRQMMAYLYQIVREPRIDKGRIYEEFFQSPFVRRFCDQEGIEQATLEAARRRCPFLLNVLDAADVLTNGRSEVVIEKLVLTPSLVASTADESPTVTTGRYRAVISSWPARHDLLSDGDLSILRELFGASFLTDAYHWRTLDPEEV